MDVASSRDRLAATLKTYNTTVVFAESCTGGMCSGVMAQVDGVSDFLCGSAATYMPALKQGWLGVSPDIMAQHTCESQPVANAMAMGVLGIAPEAQWSAAVVGHLAHDLECRVWIAVARQDDSLGRRICCEAHSRLNAKTREQRQFEAVALVLETLRDTIVAAAEGPTR